MPPNITKIIQKRHKNSPNCQISKNPLTKWWSCDIINKLSVEAQSFEEESSKIEREFTECLLDKTEEM